MKMEAEYDIFEGSGLELFHLSDILDYLGEYVHWPTQEVTLHHFWDILKTILSYSMYFPF